MNTDVLKEFANEIRHQLLLVHPSHQQYENLDVLLRDSMEAVNKIYDAAASRCSAEERELFNKRAKYYLAVINESFGELLADWREGMPYEDFMKCLQEEETTWHREIID